MATINFGGLSVEAITNNSSSETKTLANNVTTVSLTINSGTFDLSTYNCTSTGATTLSNANSTLKIGTSSNTGLTTAGITWNTGTKRDWQIGSVINCSGNWVEPNEAISVSANRGMVTLTGNGTLAKSNGNNNFYEFTINSGVTTTLTVASYLTSYVSNKTIINGTLNTDTGYFVVMGVKADGVFTVGVNGNFSGAGHIYFYNAIPTTATYTNARATAFSVTGYIGVPATVANLYIPAWDFSNATARWYGSGSAAGAVIRIGSGTFKCKNMSFYHQNNYGYTLDNSAYNPNIYISDAVTWDAGVTSVTYTKGTGTITLDGTSGTSTIDFAGKSVEAIVVAAGTGIKEFASNCTTSSFTGTAGTVRSTVAGAQRTITVGATSSVSGMTFKDISFGAKQRVNAKTGGNTNMGNNLGIVFKDMLVQGF